MRPVKKFHFSMDSVLSYRNQVLDALITEHAAILARVRAQEEAVDALQRNYRAFNEAYCRQKEEGMTIAEARSCNIALRVQERDIQRALETLQAVRQEAENKRAEVVKAKQDGAVIEKLKEQKLALYNKAVEKSEEQFIDEFVSMKRAIASA